MGRDMIKLRGKRGDREFLLLGLSAGNVAKLRDGKPVEILKEELGIGFDIAIMYGETEQAIVAELQSLGLELPDPTTWKPSKN